MGQTEIYARERRTGRINSLVIEIYHGAIKIIAATSPRGRNATVEETPPFQAQMPKLSTIENLFHPSSLSVERIDGGSTRHSI